MTADRFNIDMVIWMFYRSQLKNLCLTNGFAFLNLWETFKVSQRFSKLECSRYVKTKLSCCSVKPYWLEWKRCCLVASVATRCEGDGAGKELKSRRKTVSGRFDCTLADQSCVCRSVSSGHDRDAPHPQTKARAAFSHDGTFHLRTDL